MDNSIITQQIDSIDSKYKNKNKNKNEGHIFLYI